MKCWICSRQARGYGHTDARFKPGNPQRYVLDWVFCSERCQNAFSAMYGNWARTKAYNEEPPMVDATDIERTAMRKCLRYFGEAAAEIGFDKPLGAYSEAEAMKVIEAIVTGFTQHMVVQHEQTKYPPMRGIAKPATDPFNKTGFEDMVDDIPWKEHHA